MRAEQPTAKIMKILLVEERAIPLIGHGIETATAARQQPGDLRGCGLVVSSCRVVDDSMVACNKMITLNEFKSNQRP